SLIAVFIPILLMGGIVGRLFREFAVTLSIAIAVSLVVSLTTTPMMCALFLRAGVQQQRNAVARASERVFDWLHRGYESSLAWVLRHSLLTLGVAMLTVCVNVYLYTIVPKGFFPVQDTGRLFGSVQADQATSFQAMQEKLAAYAAI